MKHTADKKLVIVFEGAYQDAAFLASLVTGSGIEALLDPPIQSEATCRGTRVLVRRRDVDQALPLVRDFEENGKKQDR